MLPTLQPGGAGPNAPPAAAFASALSVANAGVAVVDCTALAAKTKKQLAGALQAPVRWVKGLRLRDGPQARMGRSAGCGGEVAGRAPCLA